MATTSKLLDQLKTILEKEKLVYFEINEALMQEVFEEGILTNVAEGEDPLAVFLSYLKQRQDNLPLPSDEHPSHVTCFHLPVNAQVGQWPALIRVHTDTRKILVYSVFPYKVDVANKSVLLEVLHRLNYGLIAGNFELDVDEGLVRYKTYITVGNKSTLNQAQMTHGLYANFFTMERYFSLIKYVCQHRFKGSINVLVDSFEESDDLEVALAKATRKMSMIVLEDDHIH